MWNIQIYSSELEFENLELDLSVLLESHNICDIAFVIGIQLKDSHLTLNSSLSLKSFTEVNFK